MEKHVKILYCPFSILKERKKERKNSSTSSCKFSKLKQNIVIAKKM
jgi:hypothetical protein